MNVNEAMKVVNRCDEILKHMIESEVEKSDNSVLRFKLDCDDYRDLKEIIQKYKFLVLDTELVKDMW